MKLPIDSEQKYLICPKCRRQITIEKYIIHNKHCQEDQVTLGHFFPKMIKPKAPKRK